METLPPLHGLFDSHAHYDDAAFDTDRASLLGEALPAAGVGYVLNAGTDAASIQAGRELCARYPYFYCAAGHHPHTAKDVSPDYLARLREDLKDPKVAAIGEIGLDYHYELSDRAAQQKVFREQLELAKETGYPVIIHMREATADTLELLRRFRPQGVVHCFSGSAEVAREILDLGLYLGFTGLITFQNAKKAREAAATAPLDRLLIETDCPYMTPVPFRGKRCDSTLLHLTARVLAQLKGIDPQTLADRTAENARRLYRIPG